MKTPIKIALYIAVTLSCVSKIFSQQETQLSMYFFNPLLINPAYAGSQEAMQITGTARNQWSGLTGSPQTQMLSIHSPLKIESIGVGLTVLNDQLGVTKNTGIYGNLAYSVKLNKRNDRLAFGTQLGMDIFRQDFSNLRIIDNTDQLYVNGGNYQKNLFNVGAGIYYYGKRFYLGASSPRLLKNKLESNYDQKALQENHVYLFGGIVIKLNAAINMRPSFIIKYVNSAPLSIEGNLSFLFYEKLWVGAMYRHGAAAGANVMYSINQNLRVGYAYDYQLTALQNYSFGSHEIMLSYTFKSSSKGFKSPRYF
ncbi:MAG: type IX secretion system membrane protein PorP/SprF [Bacteroidetes bacterium]|nr:type IX secretion system membrane protein PorP/SprF [Bacteroidota bacterium]